ncbi:hypothetical protein DRJ24_00335 [Candidatus Acetothermia bacterium]|nr:MAG: hypothetical protein DRJ24_00335 [Candidatus Acetothermia bacterium]
MNDAIVYWIETTEEEVHFIDAIVSAYDGLANVRRVFRVEEGATVFKVFVAPGMEDEFLELIERLRRAAKIGRVVREGTGDGPTT